ncbi:hypothetical protein N7454_005886 [Penicillium verhagenii]|nr:hypothetical protein N7454_005886 [Penicillium verhagenii]
MTRYEEKRPVKVANCSGYHGDPAYEMYRQATLGDVDFITGDYLAEVNLANNALTWRSGKHPGYEETAWEGLRQTIDVIAEKGIRVVINGGALDPKALAMKTKALTLLSQISDKNLNLQVAYLSGDDLYPLVGPNMPVTKEELLHLDSGNPSIVQPDLTYAFLNTTNDRPFQMVSAHAYLGARGIVDGLRRGADIIICGRVSDASPVIAAAWFWHNWNETDYDRLAGSLIAGHLIECSAYVTGGNFSGFDRYPSDDLVSPGFPIAEIAGDGTCIITKHPGTQGMVNVDTVRCQFLYELQGTAYLNSDVSAHIADVQVEDVREDRVYVSGIRGSPPPSTTKFAVFYQGGYEAQILMNATGYATTEKWDLLEKQVRHFLPDEAKNELETLEFQRVGTPCPNPCSQLESTTYLRIFVASPNDKAVLAVLKAMGNISLKHFSGYHLSMDLRTALPLPFLAYYPALIKQSDIPEAINFVDDADTIRSYKTGHPPKYEELGIRENYDTPAPEHFEDPAHWSWLRSYMTRDRMRELISSDWKDGFFIERVEFPRIHAVHFVIYGILGRGVSSSSRLDGFGKGFADYIRDKVVDVPLECF